MKQKRLKKKVYQYTAVFEPDQKSGGYTVIIPTLPGCISEGNTFEEASKNIQEAADLYLKTMKVYQGEIPRETSGIIIAPIQVKA